MWQSAVQEISLDSVRIFWLDYPLITERLKEILEKFKDYPEILEVWVFGSFAQLKAVPGSDIDLLLVMKESEKRLIDRIERYQDMFSDMGMSVDVFPYTIQESDLPFVQNAKRTGICIYNVSDEQVGTQGLIYLEDAAKGKRKRIR